MPMLRAIRLLSSISAGITSGSQLETLLADPGRLSDLNQLLTLRSQIQLLVASPTAMAAVAASPTAMAAVIDSPTAMAAVAASPTAMAAMRASPLVVEASTSGNVSANSTITLSMAAASANNIQVTPGATGRAIVVAAKLSNSGSGSADPLVGFTGGTTGWEWNGENEVLVAASATIPTTPGTVSFTGASNNNRTHIIYYIPV